jgi:hypothetical protein
MAPRSDGADAVSPGRLRRARPWGLLAVPAVGLLLWLDPLGDVLGALGGIDPLWLIAASREHYF